jgi:malate synthase
VAQAGVPKGVEITGALRPGFERVLTPEAMGFVAALQRRFSTRKDELMQGRLAVQARYDRGERPDFLDETAAIRAGDWTVAPLPKDLLERRVEITGPVDRKMIINALNSGASVFMADFEDSTSPTWDNLLTGQANLQDAVRREIAYIDPATKKSYALGQKLATLMVRPRGWHLPEAHMRVDGGVVSGSLFDFGLFFFHNAKELLGRGSGPYFYLPKLQSHLEARLWNDVFVFAEAELGVPRGSIKATVLIETLPAAFEMDEILYELREHSAGLNCGRWDYIFSFIKTFRAHKDFVLPDRALVTMEQPCMRAYTQLVVRTCHRRGVHAMGGMAAQIPVKTDPERNARALEKVRADKLREVKDGHDGTWVAHPGLVPVAREIFDAHMKAPNQLDKLRDDVRVSAADLIAVPRGVVTLAGVRQNVNVGVQYLAAWLSGQGCVPLHDLMEDAATAEISRTQIWQWLEHGVRLEDGSVFTEERLRDVTLQEIAAMRPLYEGRLEALDAARELFVALSTQESCADFLTLPAYAQLLARERETKGGRS